MTKMVYLDRGLNEDQFVVTYPVGGVYRRRSLDSRDAAESYAQAKAGARGAVVSTLDQTAAQQTAFERRLEEFRFNGEGREDLAPQ